MVKGIEALEEKTELNLVSLRIVKEASLREQYGKVSSPADVRALVQSIIGSNDRESFGVICLDTKNQPTNISIVSIGTLNSSMVHPREVFKTAILSNSAGIILFHNHPSGNTSPSNSDIEITKQLEEVGQIIGIKVIDHLIVAEEGYLSMKEENLLS